MEEINKKLKEWGSICRISNIKEDPLTFSYSDMLSFAKYYHESQAKNNESLHDVINCDCETDNYTKRESTSGIIIYKCKDCGGCL